ncbi:LamG domain-containing protein [Mesotoga prima]|uniref:LamG domain-containing protein n=1 Tax=Mesotoga prima TaxID=1184387 RepID=UPI002FDB0943
MIAVHVPIGNRYFDGTDDYVDIGEVAELKLTTYTVTAWFKISSMPSGIEYILGWGTKGFWIYIDGPNKKINIEYMTSTGTSGGTIGYDFWWNNGKWHMVTLYRDQSTGFVRIYLDDNIGVRYTSSASTVYASGERLAIGRKGSSASNYFTGWLRDIRIYDYAVPDEDISNLVYRTSEPTTPPVSQWLLDETSGSTAHDNEGDNDGTFYGGSGSEPKVKFIPRRMASP